MSSLVELSNFCKKVLRKVGFTCFPHRSSVVLHKFMCKGMKDVDFEVDENDNEH